ncbi:hypothetical protein ACFPOE_12665 [Caenimonas terrae]|uniref:O-antigen ligase domain-containing protein n=1 Tax=Caenimonas terrae TaxID=696074 RepID=A0ABW0NCS2_9BURK
MHNINGSWIRGRLFGLLIVLSLISWPALLASIFPEISYQKLPSPLDLFPALVSWVLLSTIRCPYSRLLGYAWVIWYFVGVLNTLSSSIVLGSYYGNLRLQEATEIYFWGCAFYFAGMLLFEKTAGKRKKSVYGVSVSSLGIHPIFRAVLLAFPIAWLASMYWTLGYIPILRGVNIVDDMYEIGYGPLYPYGPFLIVSILFAAYRCMSAGTHKRRISYGVIALLFIIISMADGKRAFAMVAFGGVCGISFKLFGRKTWWPILPIFASAMLALYVGVLLLRGDESGVIRFDAYEKMMLVGVEFRDFVYTVNYAKPGEIQNYSWAVSSLASVTNNLAMKVLGLDKTALVNLDSAHAWATIWGSNFGIRTGILSELWFSYGGMAMPLLVLYGFLSGILIRGLRAVRSGRDLIFFSSLFGLLVLNITSQSTFTFGILPTLLYLYVVVRGGSDLLHQRNLRRNRILEFYSGLRDVGLDGRSERLQR